MSKLTLQDIIQFLEGFHSFTDFDKKFSLFSEFLAKWEIKEAFFINGTTFEIKKLIGDPPLADETIAYLKKNLNMFLSEEIIIQDKAFGVIKIGDYLNNWGALFYYPIDSIDDYLKRFLALELSCLITNLNINTELKKRQNEIKTIKMLSEMVSNFLNLKEVLKVVAEYVTKSLFCKGAVIRLVNKETNLLDIVEEFGLEDINIRRFGIHKGSGVSGQVWAKKEPLLVVPDTEASRELLSSTLGVGSLICVPLIFENEVIGTLSVYQKLNNEPFLEEDKIFLEVIGSLISPIISYVDTLERERRLREIINLTIKDLQLITEINKVIMQPRRIDELLYIILTALTFGEDIGFNRAAIFTYNFNTEILQGMLGVGCETIEETKTIWENLPKNISTLKWLQDFSKLIIYDNTPFNEKIKSLRFDIKKLPFIYNALKRGKIYLASEEERDIIKDEFNVKKYAVVPLIGKENILGIIYVDNKFTNKKIDERYIRLLEIFASQAALAIENSKVLGELKDTNNMLKLAQQEILMKEKLAAVGEMLTTLAHEIRNPLTTIGGFSEILVKKIEDKNLKELAEKIYNQAQRMERMFNSFLYLTKNRNFKKEPVDIKSLISLCVEQFLMAGYKNININLHFCEEDIIANIDRQMFAVIIENLIKNAIQAMPQGGNIDISLSKDDNSFVFSVEDEGQGISEDILPKIFDPFFSTKFDGFGIGLSISYKIIKNYGGTIYTENKKPKGAKFTVKMPLSKNI